MSPRNTLCSGLFWSGMLVGLAPAEPAGLDFDQVPAAGGQAREVSRPARTSPLGQEELRSLLSRLSPLKAAPADRQDFALRPGSLPAPKTGKRISQDFPPPPKNAPAPADKRPVEVLRYAPEGDVEVAPQLSVTFNQPMVDLSSAATPKSVPVKLTPESPGGWRWVGTQTLVFQPQTRLPMATEYRAEVTAPMSKSVAWSFRTPPPRLVQSFPQAEGIGLRPVLFLGFDQRVPVERIASMAELVGQGSKLGLRRASAQEIAQDPSVQALVGRAEADRWVALVPVQPLAAGTQYQLNLPAGLPSLEGPRITASAQSFSFSTYAPLRIDDSSRHQQPPGSPLYVSFNNPLDAATLQPESVQVSPELPGMRAVVRGDSLWIHGRTRGRTTYTVTVPASLRDKFGQSLGKATPVTIQVGSAPSLFLPPIKNFLILDPLGPPQLTFTTVNQRAVQVKVYAVQPRDWSAYHQALGHRWDQEKMTMPGALVWEKRVDASAPADEIGDVKVDLAEAFDKSNQLIVVATPELADPAQRRYQSFYGWVQRSQLGANLTVDGKQMVAWINRLSDGKPVEGAEVQFLHGKSVHRSGPDGIALLPWESGDEGVVIRSQKDRLFMPRSVGSASGHFNPGPSADQHLWYVTDDRRLYKPGETVSVKGWLRRQIHQPTGDLANPSDKTLRYKLFDSRHNEISKGQTAIGGLGGFDFQFTLPKNFNLGSARLELSSDSSSHQHSFQVQEFRRPEFEVSASAETGSTLVGGRGSLAVEAKYYAGGGLKDAPVNWTVSATPSNYSPPHWDDFSFGSWTPWWDCYCWWSQPNTDSQSKSFGGRTNHQGKHTLDLQFRAANPPRPYSVTGTATVSDVNRQAWSTSTHLLVHPANQYVGIKARSSFVEAGRPLHYELIVTDLDGKAIAGRPLQVKAYRLSWEYADEENKTLKKEVFSQQVLSGSAPVSVAVPTGEGGTYQLEVSLQDDSNRSNQSQMISWVAGGKQPPKRDVEMQPLTLIPNKKEYDPGEVAEILVQSPFRQAQAMVTLERHGLVSRSMLDLSQGHQTLRIPLEEGYLPNLHVTVDVVGQEARSDEQGHPVAGAPPRPAQARGSLNLAISAKSRQLQVAVRPLQARSQPGAQNQLELTLKDAQGKPVAQGEVALLVVDEAILALAGGDFGDPWSLFYAHRAAEVQHHGMRDFVELALPQEISAAFPPPPPEAPMPVNSPTDDFRGGDVRKRASLNGAGKMREESQAAQAPIRVRQDFSALAYYVPGARTDAEGRLKLPFKLPDNLTRYRIVALAAAGEKQFGKGQSSLVAQQPLMVRPSPPRFLNFGDRCELPVVVQNQTDKSMLVQLACRTSNLQLDPKLAGVSLQVAANDRAEVRFPVSAEEAGTARFQVGATSGAFADAAQGDFPVWTPATSETFATYGNLDQGALEQTVTPPGDIFRQFGGLEISTSSTALAELTDAFLYLRQYPYECAEQVSSRVLSTVALAPVLRAFEAPGMPSEAELKNSLAADVKKLQGMQNYDGGWDYWKRDKPSVPYVSLHVSHALVRLKKAGHSLDEQTYDQALNYVDSVESHIPSDYGENTKRTLRAYALYVLHLAGRPDAARARKLVQDWGGVDKTPLESLGWLLPTLSSDTHSKEAVSLIRRQLNNRVSETASTAQFVTQYDDKAFLILASDHRDDAILLEALIQDQPNSDLLPKLVRNLLDHRIAGRWSSTQENCFVLLALHEYFQKFEKVTPDFVARVWLGPRYAGQQSFKGRSADSKELGIPMDQLEGQQNLVISKEGPGRLYYRLGMKYAPKNLKLAPMERGFSVERRYQAVDDNRDVRQDPDGSWHIKAGSKVKVNLTMVCPSMRYHVALVDPLPAGLEAINPALQGSEPARPSLAEGRARWWWNPWWYEHENLRDERVEAFSQWVYYGVHEYNYFARATTPGQFVVPPARAEEMYHPETFGRSQSDRVVVEP